MDPDDLAAERDAELSRWESLAAEMKLHQHLAVGPRFVMQGKRLLLLKHLLLEIDWSYVDLLIDLVRGMPLVGNIPDSGGVFTPRVIPAEILVDALMRVATAWRTRLVQAMGPSSDLNADAALTRKTYDEVVLGNLHGPFTEAEMQARVGSLFVPTRRFVVQQGYETKTAAAP